MTKKRTLSLVLAIILLICSGIGYLIYDRLNSQSQEDENKLPQQPLTAEGEFSIHFLELGNQFSGDCVLVDYGDTEVLIDAGSRTDSAETIIPYINNYVSDNKLEYVIATHADRDHIVCLPAILDEYQVDTIIDFPRTSKKPTDYTYGKYIKARDGSSATHYTALQCFEKTDGAQDEYFLGENVSFRILYNYYYYYDTSDENNYSVCLLFRCGDKQYLHTADLEESGEKKLAEHYAAKGGIGKCELFKAGHHGSRSSSNEEILDDIQPENVVFTCPADTQEYLFGSSQTRFPSQAAITRIAKYTDKVYVTTLITDWDTDSFTSFNGNVVFKIKDGQSSIQCSNNNIPLKDSEWFKANRTWPEPIETGVRFS